MVDLKKFIIIERSRQLLTPSSRCSCATNSCKDDVRCWSSKVENWTALTWDCCHLTLAGSMLGFSNGNKDDDGVVEEEGSVQTELGLETGQESVHLICMANVYQTIINTGVAGLLMVNILHIRDDTLLGKVSIVSNIGIVGT